MQYLLRLPCVRDVLVRRDPPMRQVCSVSLPALSEEGFDRAQYVFAGKVDESRAPRMAR